MNQGVSHHATNLHVLAAYPTSTRYKVADNPAAMPGNVPRVKVWTMEVPKDLSVHAFRRSMLPNAYLVAGTYVLVEALLAPPLPHGITHSHLLDLFIYAHDNGSSTVDVLIQ